MLTGKMQLAAASGKWVPLLTVQLNLPMQPQHMKEWVQPVSPLPPLLKKRNGSMY